MSHVCEEPEPLCCQDVPGQHAQPQGHPRTAQGTADGAGSACSDSHARNLSRHAGQYCNSHFLCQVQCSSLKIDTKVFKMLLQIMLWSRFIPERNN